MGLGHFMFQFPEYPSLGILINAPNMWGAVVEGRLAYASRMTALLVRVLVKSEYGSPCRNGSRHSKTYGLILPS